MRFIETFREGNHISDVYLCKTKQIALTKNGKEYGSLVLQDKTGTVDAKIWELNSPGINEFAAMDYVFVDADYSQIELRVLAHMSGDERLIEAYRESRDIHATTASQVFHVPLEEVTPLQRRNAKAVNFGIVYGISAFGLSEDLSISRKEAKEYIERYFETYPKVKEFLDSLVKQGKEQGYVTTLYGRRRPIPEFKSSNFMQRQFGERVAMNSPIQGTAADIMKIAMIAVDRELRKRGLSSRIVLQIHDELLIETAENEVEEVKEILTDKMKHAANLKVSLEVDAKTGASWFDAK